MLQVLTYILVALSMGIVVIDVGAIIYRNAKHYLEDNTRFGRDFEMKYCGIIHDFFGEIPFTMVMFFAFLFTVIYGLAWMLPKPPNDQTDTIVFIANLLYTVPSILYIVFSVVMKQVRMVNRLKKKGGL